MEDDSEGGSGAASDEGSEGEGSEGSDDGSRAKVYMYMYVNAINVHVYYIVHMCTIYL